LVEGDKKKRMAYAFRRGFRSMGVTSSTTAAAFFANVFSPIMPIKAFGIFAGTLIPVNFMLVVLIMPPAVIYREERMKDTCWCFGGKSPTSLKSNKTVELFFSSKWNSFVCHSKYYILFLVLIWEGITIFYSL
jgi:predicted RND superfamily exporter protein